MRRSAAKTTTTNLARGYDPESRWCQGCPEAWACRMSLRVDRINGLLDELQTIFGHHPPSDPQRRFELIRGGQ